MTSFSLSVRYAAGNEVVTTGLTAAQMHGAAAEFIRDLIGLEGQAITRVIVEVEVPAGEVRA